MARYLLGIDVGTTGTKTMLFSEDGALLGHAYQAYAMKTPRVGWSEQDAEDWWQAVVQTVRQVCADPEIAQNVAAISLSLQGGTLVAVDENGQQLRPAMVWNDIRCTQQRQEYLQEGGTARGLYETTGWALIDGLPLLQIRWMREQEPELFERAAMFLTVPDYISLKMTGIPAVDLSDAGINQLIDIRKGDYDDTLLQFAGVTRGQLPKLVRSGDVIGPLTAEAAEALGLTENCLLVAGAHDQYAVALGAGATKAGDILIGSGTCWVVTAISDAPSFSAGLSQSVAAVPGKWGSLLSLSSGGVCLDWLRRSMASPEQPIGYGELNTRIAQIKAAEDGLFFYPFSGKSRADANFQKGSFVGLDLSHDKFHMARAVMEGVAFQAQWMMESFSTKPSAEGLKLAGGASKSSVWSQITADITGLPVRIPEVADLACVGAAILAGTGCGIFSDAAEGYRRLAVQERVLYPNPKQTAIYAPLVKEYRRCAEVLGGVYGL